MVDFDPEPKKKKRLQTPVLTTKGQKGIIASFRFTFVSNPNGGYFSVILTYLLLKTKTCHIFSQENVFINIKGNIIFKGSLKFKKKKVMINYCNVGSNGFVIIRKGGCIYRYTIFPSFSFSVIFD